MIGFLIAIVLIGIPTAIIVSVYKKADSNTTVYSPEEVTRRLRRGFFLSFWGIDLAFGSVVSFALMFCDVNIVLKFAIPIGSVIVGFILLIIGRVQVGLMTRYINFCNRERTPLEEWTLYKMLGVENAAMRANGINAITRLTPGVTDNMLAALNGSGVIGGFFGVGKVYTGKNILKNHWPMLCIILLIVISVMITVL